MVAAELSRLEACRSGGAAERSDRNHAKDAFLPPLAVAIAYCHGTPLRNEIESHDPASSSSKATEVAAAAVAARFGSGRVEAQVKAFVTEVVHCRTRRGHAEHGVASNSSLAQVFVHMRSRL